MTIQEAIKGLNFQSEADASWNTVESIMLKGGLSCANLKRALRRSPASFCEQVDFNTWFDIQINAQPQADGYINLRDTLEDNYSELAVFKLASLTPDFNIDIYVVGIASNGTCSGIWVNAVET
jgi:hypothetical protein